MMECATNAQDRLNVNDKLRIAQLAPLHESVPPKLYGGTERVVSYITEELVRRGHEVTLFASGDSQTSAQLVPGCEEGLRMRGHPDVAADLQAAITATAYAQGLNRFDIVHSHVGYWAFPFARMSGLPTVSTMHGRLDQKELRPLFDWFMDAPLVSISDSQRRPLPNMNWIGTVGHGLPSDRLTFNPRPGQYLAFIGRLSPEKRPDLAIAVALRSGVPLKIAAKIDNTERDYFNSVVKPLLQSPHIEYVGEISEANKNDFLGNARALLFPIDWPEPFGLAMIEALACGTPVIARPCGSVPEIIDHGITGFCAESLDELVAAVENIDHISRKQCRQSFEQRFTSQTMVDKYEQIYRSIIESSIVKPQTMWAGLSEYRLSLRGLLIPYEPISVRVVTS